MIVLALFAGSCVAAEQGSETPPAPRPTWARGDSWTYRGMGGTGSYTARRTVIGEGAFEGHAAYEVEAPHYRYWYTKDLGQIARLRGDQVVRRIRPPRDWRWPLEVGKAWSSPVEVEDTNSGRRRAVTDLWRVEAYESVVTPAGTFKAYKLVRRELEGGTVEEFWYSPVAKWWVKLRGSSPAGRYEEELIAFSVR